TACDEGMMLGHAIPKESRSKTISGFPGVNVTLKRAEQFGHLGVAMFAGQNVFMAGERIDNCVMLEIIGGLEPTFVARVRIEIDHDFVHAAEFGGKHPLDLR